MPSANTTFSARFALYERVYIDDCKDLMVTVTCVQFRSTREPLYELSWVANGTSQTAWIEEPRLERLP